MFITNVFYYLVHTGELRSIIQWSVIAIEDHAGNFIRADFSTGRYGIHPYTSEMKRKKPLPSRNASTSLT